MKNNIIIKKSEKKKNINKKRIIKGGKRSRKRNLGGTNLDKYYLDIHKNYKCAPNVYFYKSNIYNEKLGTFDSCFNTKQLKNIVIAYNKTKSSDKQISEDILKTDDRDLIWSTIRDKLYQNCGNDEYCWTKDKLMEELPANVKDEILTKTFKPERPLGRSGKNMSAWLSNIDIENVLEQLYDVYKDFILLGPFPIDYKKYPQLYELNTDVILEAINKGKKRIGVMFNTGTLKSGGVHWVCLFLDFVNGTIEYFDSVGHKPPKVIGEFINDVNNDICSRFTKGCIKMHEKIKQLQHQKGNNECGVYCLYFITEKLKGRSYEDIQSNEMTDSVMFQFRNKFFTM
jgi:transcriptional regulator NrdR family protein